MIGYVTLSVLICKNKSALHLDVGSVTISIKLIAQCSTVFIGRKEFSRDNIQIISIFIYL